MSHGHDDHAHLAGPEARKRIWTVFFILFAITALEFVIAFTMERGFSRNLVFIVMTVVKAFYIVGYFMHMKDEVKSLVYTVLLPLAFLMWFLVAMLVEGVWYIDGWFKFLSH